ncbi:gliding motility-associated C-terminal domain-containing protein [Sediminibacterium soli]|uniref:gliding motility-associated C-terminal domain-containing protein n=1 Tax=Sediminibacterium soli TaxID=2698829 RepID=UPI00137A321C|nr:gliding motility-associated C-terminal domain-containing protein [Sediminibacterium soli]NCI47610.1 gliding motility-associated C-terminal domain-containing protein [Sediminibacterium soli]
MKKNELLLYRLLVLAVFFCSTELYSQSGCSPFIRLRDTIVCSGTPLTLDLQPPPPPDSILPGVWKLLITRGAIDSLLFNLKSFGFDRVNQYLYSINYQRITRFDLKNNTVSSIPATNWPGDLTEFVFDPLNNRLLLWKSGRDEVFALPAAGGSWVSVGPGALDRDAFGAASFWNPVTKQPGFYGGYGFNKTKGWIYEHNGTAWQQKRPDLPVDTVPKGGNIIGANADGSKVYMFSGQGNYTGDELTGTCLLGSPWATASGMYCWLRDLWELDLATYRFRNLLPVNNPTIQYEGAVAYDYDSSRFFLFGGFQPTGNAVQNQSLPNTFKTFRYRLGKDTGFVAFTGEGAAPPAAGGFGTNGKAYYDKAGKRIIWARYDGIWAYYPDSSLIPFSQQSYKWSTGETTASINIKPTATTTYFVNRIASGKSCNDTITVTIPNMATNIQKKLDVCGSQAKLDAGPNFQRYQWSTGETTQSINVTQNGSYGVAVTIGGCTVKDTSVVRFAVPILDFVVRNLKDSICPGESDSLYVVSPQANIEYAWYIPGNPNPVNKGSSLVLQNIIGNTDYIVNATGTPPACPAKSAATRIILRSKLPKPVIRAEAVGVPDVNFRWDVVPNAVSYRVSIDKGTSYAQVPAGGSQALVQVVTNLGPNQPATIAVIAEGRFVCETSDSSQLTVITPNPFGNNLYIPNAFTPNGDGVNDEFLVYATAMSSIRLMVYNQWGKQVFETKDRRLGWDGTYSGKPSPAGTYTYALEAIMQNGQRVTKVGTFSLIR